jgi:glycine cleavage system T protein
LGVVASNDRAQTVIIGAGIVGASAAYHLAELGVTDVLVVDQGPLFETGGSTSHAPGLVFQTNASRTMCRIAQYTVDLYSRLSADGQPCWFGVGGIEVATTEARMAELKRRLGFARSYGIDGAELLTPTEAADLVPLLERSAILGAYHVPSDGIAKAVGIVTALAGRAEARGVRFEGDLTVTGLDLRDGRVRGVRTEKGYIECERVLICAGIWGPTVGAMAGVPIPLVSVQHQLVWTDPVPELSGEEREVVHPILRHQDMSMYFRQRRDHYAVGNYRHEPIITPQSDIRPPRGPIQPSLMPFTPSDFDGAEREAATLLPALEGLMRPADPDRSINGMFSFTPDAGSIVGQSATVRGIWVCEAVWVTHAGGMGRMVAEWMAEGEPSMDMGEADANRFYPFQTTPAYVQTRGAQQYREVYDVLHPLQQMERPRRVRLTPFYDRQEALGAEFFSGAGWERPQWFRANEPRVPAGAVWAERTGWAALHWSPAVGAEHIATRTAAGLFDLTPFAKFHVEGPDASAFLERVCANRIQDRPVGSIVYTAMLTPKGGIRCDLTVTRLDEDRFHVVTGAGSAMHDLAWLRAQIGDERVRVDDRSTERFALGIWGPRARDILQPLSPDDLSNDAFPYLTAKEIRVGEVPVLAQRISYAGELGWELYGPLEMGSHTWDLIWQRGLQHGMVAAGGGAFDSLRLEKGYRLWGQDISTEHDPFEAGLGFVVRMDKRDFQGKPALERIIEFGSPNRLSCMVLDDPAAVVMGKEPVWSGERPVSYVTSAAYGYTFGRQIAYGYLPVELAAEGTLLEIEYFGERLPARVAADPLIDPKGERLRL